MQLYSDTEAHQIENTPLTNFSQMMKVTNPRVKKKSHYGRQHDFAHVIGFSINSNTKYITLLDVWIIMQRLIFACLCNFSLTQQPGECSNLFEQVPV